MQVSVSLTGLTSVYTVFVPHNFPVLKPLVVCCALQLCFLSSSKYSLSNRSLSFDLFRILHFRYVMLNTVYGCVMSLTKSNLPSLCSFDPLLRQLHFLYGVTVLFIICCRYGGSKPFKMESKQKIDFSRLRNSCAAPLHVSQKQWLRNSPRLVHILHACNCMKHIVCVISIKGLWILTQMSGIINQRPLK